MALNNQELRNAKFWGEFKAFAYRKSAEYKSFLIDNKTFNDKELSRMLDVEFFSILIIHAIDGITTDSAKTIDNYYKKYDTLFDNLENVEEKIDKIFYVLSDLFENKLFQTKFFHRKNYLYTLFCTLNNQIFGTLDIDVIRNDKFTLQNIDSNIDFLTDKLMNFESNYGRFLNGDYFSDDIEQFISFEQNHRTRTTSAKERKERIKILSNALI